MAAKRQKALRQMKVRGRTRTETDTFGPIQVAADRYWGAQAQRSLGNFKIGWEKQPAPVIRALGIVKRAAAETNMTLGGLDKKIGETIIAAALPAIAGELGGFESISWVASIYLLIATAVTPLYGKFSDIKTQNITLGR